MKLLIIAATSFEITGFADWLKANAIEISNSGKEINVQKHLLHDLGIDILITGVGIHAVTYALTKQLQCCNYSFVLQVGVGGSFDTNLPLGSMVNVSSDRFADLGAEDKDEYIDIFDMGLLKNFDAPYTNGTLIAPVSELNQSLGLPMVSGLTVNTVSGSAPTIYKRTQKYNCSIESMEGAAFHFVCIQENFPFAQVRAISNYVTPRDKSSWKMKEAIYNLNNWLIGFIEQLPKAKIYSIL